MENHTLEVESSSSMEDTEAYLEKMQQFVEHESPILLSSPGHSQSKQEVTEKPNKSWWAPNKMEYFALDQQTDMKRIIYNLLVANYNQEDFGELFSQNLVHPIVLHESGKARSGFQFNNECQPEKRLPELYAWYMRGGRLDQLEIGEQLVNDLYKHYHKCFTGLIAKYFDKVDPNTYLYRDLPLFIPGEMRIQADRRIAQIQSKHRGKKKQSVSDTDF